MDKNLKKLLIKTKKGVFGHQIGNNSSKFKGDGYDFVELREYEDGEDIRKIDWIISAKLQKPYVKVFHTQRQLNIAIIPILGGSLHFGTVRMKKDLAVEICAALGYAAISSGDNFISFNANETVTLNTKKSKQLFSVDKMCENIHNYDLINKHVNYNTITKEIFNKIKERSIIFLIGDFFGAENIDLKLLAKKHEVVAIIIRDKFEEHPKALGNVNFTDPENYNKFEGNIDKSLVQAYEKKVKINDHILFEHLKKASVEFTKIYTNDNCTAKLMKLLK